MIQSAPIECDYDAQYLVYLNPATGTKWRALSLINDFAQDTLQVRPRFLKAECYPIGTYTILLTIFGEPNIIVLGFLFSLLCVPMGTVFSRRPVTTLTLEKENALGNPMMQLVLLSYSYISGLKGYTVVWHSMIIQMSPDSGLIQFLDKRVSVRGIAEVDGFAT